MASRQCTDTDLDDCTGFGNKRKKKDSMSKRKSMQKYLADLHDRVMDADDATSDQIYTYLSTDISKKWLMSWSALCRLKMHTRFQALGIDQGWNLESFTRERRSRDTIGYFYRHDGLAVTGSGRDRYIWGQYVQSFADHIERMLAKGH